MWMAGNNVKFLIPGQRGIRTWREIDCIGSDAEPGRAFPDVQREWPDGLALEVDKPDRENPVCIKDTVMQMLWVIEDIWPGISQPEYEAH